MRRSLTGFCLALVMAAACGPARPYPPRSPGPTRGAAAPGDPVAHEFSPAETPLPELVADVGRLARATNPGRLEALLATLRDRELEFELQSFPNPHRERDPRAQGQNVIVTLGEGERDIMLGAHYDAVRLPDGELSAGAVDNGAGAVVLTRVAESLRSRRLHHRVRVVFFDLEEIGLVGSRHFVATLDTTRVAAMINVDVVGYGGAVMFGPASHEGNEAVYAALYRVCGRWALSCLDFPQYPPSDDRSFQAAGIPNISIGMQPRVEAYQMWLVLNAGAESGLREGFRPPIFEIIHSERDRVQVLDPMGMTTAYNAVMGLVLELDRAAR